MPELEYGKDLILNPCGNSPDHAARCGLRASKVDVTVG